MKIRVQKSKIKTLGLWMTHLSPCLDVKDDELFRVCRRQEGCVRVDADGLVPGEAVLDQVEVEGVHQFPVVGVDVDVPPRRHLRRALHHTDLLLAVHEQLVLVVWAVSAIKMGEWLSLIG